MAIVQQYLYTNEGTELDFIQAIIDLICSLDSNITVEDVDGNPTTVAAQYADLTSASQADFYLRFNDNFRLELKRAANNSATTYSYNFKCPSYNRDMRFTFAGKTPTVEWTRQYYITTVIGTNVKLIYIGDYTVTGPAATACSILYVNDSGNVYVGHTNSSVALNATLFGDSSTITYAPMLSYTAEAGHIDYIDSAQFVSGTIKAVSTDEIYSCSTLSPFTSIALPNGKNYFVIGNNAMMEIDP